MENLTKLSNKIIRGFPNIYGLRVQSSPQGHSKRHQIQKGHQTL